MHPQRTTFRDGRPHYVIDAHGCWLWQGYKNPKGYGRLTMGNHQHLAHRWYYEQRYGRVPSGQQLDHLCRVRHCVNPDHLEAVSALENTLRGEHPVLNPVQVREIRQRHSAGEGYKRLGRAYGVTPMNISFVIHGRSWRQVGDA